MAKGRGRAARKIDPNAQRSGETHLQWQARLAAQRDLEESAKQPPVTPEAARHGQYEQGWTEVDGRRAQVIINRGGSTVQRWLNAPPDDILGDSERAAIRYCQRLWARLDYHGPAVVFVDCGSDGHAEHEALAELAALKIRLPLRHWTVFEDICRFEHAASSRHAKVTVAFVAGMIALWRGL